MIEAFRTEEDIHTTTAARVFGVVLATVNRDQRRIAKIVNYGLLYGMSAFRLAREASLDYAEAEEVLHAYFRTFPRIEAYLEGVVSGAEERLRGNDSRAAALFPGAAKPAIEPGARRRARRQESPHPGQRGRDYQAGHD